MERFDAAIVGAGPEGLVAASLLARARLRVVVLEKSAEAGGRAASLEFHPGFWASPYADELPPIAPALFRALDLAHRGAILAPHPVSVCMSDEGETALFTDVARAAAAVPRLDRDRFLAFRAELTRFDTALASRAAAQEPQLHRGVAALFAREAPPPWPGESWMLTALADALDARFLNPGLKLHLVADATAGRSVSPFLAGTALHLLAPGAGRSGVPAGGLGTLGAALEAGARLAGATLRLGAAVSEIKLKRGRAAAAVLADGEEIPARAIVSTLDLKRTALELLPWKGLAEADRRRVEHFRMMGQRARVLIALDAPPEFRFAREEPELALGPIHVVPAMESLVAGHEAARGGAIPEVPPVTLRVPSLADPRLAPVGKAVVTATLASIPGRLRDGPWDAEKRRQLAAIALVAADRASPGIARRVTAVTAITGADIESHLGLIGGDLDGGELAPDQALGSRPFPEWPGGRTPVRGFYLAGPSAATSPFLTGQSGVRAARAVLSDIKEAWLP
jgi:phytoene dehydrogenase-like protein